MTTQLTARRHEEALAITGPQPDTGLPTMVLWLGPTLTVEIDPSQDAPVRIDTEDYTQDRSTIAALLGEEAAAALDGVPDGRPRTFDFVPGPDWANVRELAHQQWTIEWNPLPHDHALLALDLVRAKQAAAHLTHDIPNRRLLDAAYPAARALQRLLDTDAITPVARKVVQQSVDAFEAAAPLDYTVPAEQPYTIPLPLTTEEINAVLDPATTGPDVILVGSPDWRLVGNGPASTAENTITVRPHVKRPGALTIKVPAMPRADPDRSSTYQAIITDPATESVVATATLYYTPPERSYTGHTMPLRKVAGTDVLDIRHPLNPAVPDITPQGRQVAARQRSAIRVHAERLWRHPGELSVTSLAAAAAANQLLQPRQTAESPEATITVEDEHWLLLEGLKSLNVRSAATSTTAQLTARDPGTGTSFRMMVRANGTWLVLVSPGPLTRNQELLEWELQWSSGNVTRHTSDIESGEPQEIFPPTAGATPIRLRILPEDNHPEGSN